MSIAVFGAVVVSAFIQAGWNFSAKWHVANKIALFAVGWFMLGLVLLPVALLTTDFSAFDWSGVQYQIATGAIQGFYLCFLGWGYSIGEISVVYPIARGLGVAGTAVLTCALGLNTISRTGFFGLCCIVAGAAMFGFRDVPERHRRPAFVAAILIGITIMGYSVVDSLGTQHSPILLYLSAMNLIAPLFAAPYILWKLRPQTLDVIRNYKRVAFLVAVGGSAAYGIILWAYRQSPAPYVAGLREIGVLIVTLLGVFVLKEKLDRKKVVGLACLICGVILLKFA